MSEQQIQAEVSASKYPLIYGQMVKIMAQVGAVEKTRKNKQGEGYMFRGIDEIYSALQELMAEHGVFSVPEVLDIKREERHTKNGGTLTTTLLTVKYTFYAIDGSSVYATTTGEGFDSGDKSANKSMSGAHKYALVQSFCLPTKDKKDSEEDSHGDLAPRYGKPVHATQPVHGFDGSTKQTHYVVPFGKYKQKTIEEIGVADLMSYVTYLEQKSTLDQKPIDPSGPVGIFIERASEFIGIMENKAIAQEQGEPSFENFQ